MFMQYLLNFLLSSIFFIILFIIFLPFFFRFFTFILVGCFFTPLCYPFVVFLCAKVIPLQCVRTQHAEFLRYKPFIFDLRQRH